MPILAETIEAKFDLPERIRSLDGWIEMGQSLFATYPLLAVLLCLVVIDIVTGILASCIAGSISSVASHKGMMKKGVMLMAVVTARLMEVVVPQAPLMTLGCLGFVVVELTSIIENCGKAGVPLPPKLMAMFEKFKIEKFFEEKAPTVVQVNLDKPKEITTPAPSFKRPSDIVLNVHDSGEVEITDEKGLGRVVIPTQHKGEKGDRGEKGEKGDKGDPSQ